jgi:hypothetical protein
LVPLETCAALDPDVLALSSQPEVLLAEVEALRNEFAAKKRRYRAGELPCSEAAYESLASEGRRWKMLWIEDAPGRGYATILGDPSMPHEMVAGHLRQLCHATLVGIAQELRQAKPTWAIAYDDEELCVGRP